MDSPSNKAGKQKQTENPSAPGSPGPANLSAPGSPKERSRRGSSSMRLGDRLKNFRGSPDPAKSSASLGSPKEHSRRGSLSNPFNNLSATGSPDPGKLSPPGTPKGRSRSSSIGNIIDNLVGNAAEVVNKAKKKFTSPKLPERESPKAPNASPQHPSEPFGGVSPQRLDGAGEEPPRAPYQPTKPVTRELADSVTGAIPMIRTDSQASQVTFAEFPDAKYRRGQGRGSQAQGGESSVPGAPANSLAGSEDGAEEGK